MNKAVFLDRDGVVNIERGEYTWRIEDFQLTIGLVDFIKYVQGNGYLVIIISNQGGVGRGLYAIEDVEIAHKYLLKLLEDQNIVIDDIYYCPHYPASGRCLCRKPEPVMLEKAIARYNVDIEKSYFIGDGQRDAEAGKRVNIKTILIKSNDDLREYKMMIK